MLQVEKVELVYRLHLTLRLLQADFLYVIFFLNLFLFLPAQCKRRSHHSLDLYVFTDTAACIDQHTIAFATDSW